MDYTGYKKVILTDDELARIYQEGKCDKVDLVENEYLAVVNKDDEVIDKFKMKNGKIEKIPYCAVGAKSLEIMKPRNLEQYFAFDYRLERSSDGITVHSWNFSPQHPLTFVLRSQKEIKAIEGGSFSKIQENAYIIKIDSSECKINW